MKKMFFLLIAAFSASFLSAQVQNEKGLYIDSDGELFNGIISTTHNNLKADLTVKEGIIEGDVTYFYASGAKMETGSFTKGQRDQKWIRYSESGKISAIAFYSLGKKTGTWLVFDDNGNKRFEMNYNDGLKTGVWTTWDENGAVASSKDYSKLN